MDGFRDWITVGDGDDDYDGDGDDMMVMLIMMVMVTMIMMELSAPPVKEDYENTRQNSSLYDEMDGK